MSSETYIDITFDDVTIGNVPVTPVGSDLFRLEGSPLVEEAFYKDVIQVFKDQAGSYIFEKVVEPSGRSNYCYILSQAVTDSSAFNELTAKIERDGGYWERDFGGVFVVSLDASSELSLPKEILKLKRSIGIK